MSKAAFHNFIVHQIIRDSSKGALLVERSEENDLDELNTGVISNVLALFNKTGLQTGTFGKISDASGPFEQILKNHASVKGEVFAFNDFTRMTIDLARVLEAEMNKGAGKNAKPTYIAFFHHSVNSKHYLSVITLLETKGFTLEKLSFKKIDRIDLDKLHHAARIRLNDWNDGIDERYISFRVGTANSVRDYFKEFICCHEFTQAKIETKGLVDAIKFCLNKVHEKDPSLISDKLELAEKYCKENKDDDGKVSLEHLGRHLFPEYEHYLIEVAQNEPFNLSERVSIDNGGLKALVRYRGSDKRMSISFDSDLITSKEVVFDPKTGSLTFYKIPKSLRDALERK
ncbi:nucleoid-associated protein [Leclercia pneumoniae]|uniref:nucleoid-associated protein n=1 Tax=Leclercia pneumoniae TaxID=2815358 RepID=UPI0021E5AA4D|nr:nucleoid-associated protein [Leclercia pneumoniae]MCV2511049.1 nucleoid-associated protein [Leclercia pneumoniae]WNN79893.1 nucleoid-associated protein [Leclercia pneumoniae]